MSHVFVSYSKADQDCAFELVERLEAQGVSCWIAPRDIAPAADWAAEIIDAIAAAHLMVLVFSSASNESPQVRREIERAVHKQVRILPFRIEDVMPCKSLEYFLSSQHWLDAFPPPRDAHYARLGQFVGQVLQKDPFSRTWPQVMPLAAEQDFVPPAVTPARGSTATPAAAFEPADLKFVEARFTTHIGPMAQVLVKRAAARAGSLRELVTLLAGELECEEDRRRFNDACRDLGRPRG